MSRPATVPSMDYVPSRLQAKREVEDQAIKLGEERRELDERVAANIQAVIDVLPKAADAGVPFDHIATMVGVSRQTLYRWRDAVEIKRATKAG